MINIQELTIGCSKVLFVFSFKCFEGRRFNFMWNRVSNFDALILYAALHFRRSVGWDVQSHLTIISEPGDSIYNVNVINEQFCKRNTKIVVKIAIYKFSSFVFK